ncbi:hypothetical protein [Nonomuraea sp. NPDC049480]|uniref:hypothetical protein n=1 Tax=Nonomuraea sp. NPDC049480 TaxID=3364353 RepID=UPI0037B719B4
MGVTVGGSMSVGVEVGVTVEVAVEVGVAVEVAVGVCVGLTGGVSVGVVVGVSVGVSVGVTVVVGVPVGTSVGERVAVGVGWQVNVTVTVGPGSVTVTVGRGVTATAGSPLFLYVPQPSLFVDCPAPVVTGMSAVTVLHDLRLHTRCLTLKIAAPVYSTETSRWEKPLFLVTAVVTTKSSAGGVAVGVVVGGGSVVNATFASMGVALNRRGSDADVWVNATPPAPASATVPSSAPRMENLIILLL